MIEIGMVGLGKWGQRLVKSVQGKSTKVRFKSAVVTNIARSAAFAEQHAISLGTDFEALVKDPSISGIVSNGPAHLHATHSLKALNAGKPVLAIKQMALTAREGRELGTAAASSGRLLALGYNRCFYPNVVELRRRLATGVLGEVLHTEGDFCVDRYGDLEAHEWQSNPANAPAGALADHMLYLTIEVLGSIAEVVAHGYRGATRNELSDVTGVLLRSKSGKSGLLTAIGATADYHRFQVFGTKGWIAIENMEKLTFQPTHGAREEVMLDKIDVERAEVEAFADALTGAKPFPVPLELAVHSTAVIEAMDRSARDVRPIAVES